MRAHACNHSPKCQNMASRRGEAGLAGGQSLKETDSKLFCYYNHLSTSLSNSQTEGR
jgi:hypothetical protein